MTCVVALNSRAPALMPPPVPSDDELYRVESMASRGLAGRELGCTAASRFILHAWPAATAQKERDRHNGRSPLSFALAFGNNRWRRRGFALAVRRSVLCEGRDAKERHRRCGQYSECFHHIILLRHVTDDDASLQRWLTHQQSHRCFRHEALRDLPAKGKKPSLPLATTRSSRLWFPRVTKP